LTIGQLARQAGVGVETIRFYEREGLLAEPGRLPSGYRQYPPDAVERVKFIRRAQRLGFTLRESRELLDLRDDPDAGQVDVRERATDKLADIDARIAELHDGGAARPVRVPRRAGETLLPRSLRLRMLLRRTFQPGHPGGRAALLRGDPWNANLLHPRSEFASHAADG
jgi:MerR family mercuric resistance operon transcriptional regulator